MFQRQAFYTFSIYYYIRLWEGGSLLGIMPLYFLHLTNSYPRYGQRVTSIDFYYYRFSWQPLSLFWILSKTFKFSDSMVTALNMSSFFLKDIGTRFDGPLVSCWKINSLHFSSPMATIRGDHTPSEMAVAVSLFSRFT